MKSEIRALSSLYMDKYPPYEYGEEAMNRQRKIVNNLIKKLRDPKRKVSNLAFDTLSTDDQIKILHFFLEGTEREIVSNTEKIDVDKDFSIYQISNVNSSNNYYTVNGIDNMLIQARAIIRSEYEDEAVIDYLTRCNKTILQTFHKACRDHEESTADEMMGAELIAGYIRCAIDFILQYLVYRIIYNKEISTTDVVNELQGTLTATDKEVKQRIHQKVSGDKVDRALGAETAMDYFRVYLRVHSRLMEEILIYQTLEAEVTAFPELFTPLEDRYKASKIIVDDISEYYNIISEGKSFNDFDAKIKVVQEFIELMHDYNYRDCYPMCVQDLKVYFREIFCSKSVYRKQQTKTIVKNYLEKVKLCQQSGTPIPDFDKQSQYIFVREKISRGYFREKGLLQDYMAKIIFTQELYDVLLRTFLFYDTKESISCIHSILQNVLDKLQQF